MKKLINAVVGDGNNTSPARKYTVYAALITAVALVLALIILIVSSVAFSLTDGDAENTPTGGDNASADNDGGAVSSGTVQYKTVTADELAEELDELVAFTVRADREIEKGTNNLYYAQNGVEKLSAGAMDALDGMLKDFYKNNKDKLNTDIGANSNNPECDIPLIVEETADGLSFKIVVFGDDKTTFNNDKYSWLYDNSHKYGFVNEENTFTYVGAAVSTYMKNSKNATVDALVTSLKNGKPVSVKVTPVGESKATSYQIYYLAADGELKLPTNYEYEVVANGADGHFVIVNMAKKVQAETSGNTNGGVG